MNAAAAETVAWSTTLDVNVDTGEFTVSCTCEGLKPQTYPTRGAAHYASRFHTDWHLSQQYAWR